MFATKSFLEIVREFFSKLRTGRKQSNSCHDQKRTDDDLPPTDHGFRQPMGRLFQNDFDHAEQNKRGSDEANQSADGAFHSVKGSRARAASIWGLVDVSPRRRVVRWRG